MLPFNRRHYSVATFLTDTSISQSIFRDPTIPLLSAMLPASPCISRASSHAWRHCLLTRTTTWRTFYMCSFALPFICRVQPPCLQRIRRRIPSFVWSCLDTSSTARLGRHSPAIGFADLHLTVNKRVFSCFVCLRFIYVRIPFD